MGQGSSLDPGLAPGLTPEEVKRLSRRFKRMSNGAGTIPVATVERELQGIPFARQILLQFDQDGDGTLTEVEVLQSVTALLGTIAEEKKLELIFRIYDKDRDGFLSKKDLQATLTEAGGGSVAPTEIEDIAGLFIKEYGKEQHGRLSLAEFKALARACVRNQLALVKDPALDLDPAAQAAQAQASSAATKALQRLSKGPQGPGKAAEPGAGR